MKSNILLGVAKYVGVLLLCFAVHYMSKCMEGVSPVGNHPDVLLGWVPIVMAAISAAGSIASGALANKQARKNRIALERKQRRLDAWREAALESDYLARADSQAALRAVRENIDEQLKAADTSAIKGGMTDEARAAYASRLNRGYADVVSQIAGMGERYRDRVRDAYIQQSGAIDDALMGVGSTSGAQNLVSGIAGAAGTLASLMGSSAGRGATSNPVKTDPVKPSERVQEMTESYHLPGNEFEENRYKINI